jgi:hypothetical protein
VIGLLKGTCPVSIYQACGAAPDLGATDGE